MSLHLWVNDRLVESSSATIDALDAGLRSGIGVFETLRVHGTATLALERHLQRLADGARRIDVPLDITLVRSALRRTLEAPRALSEVVARITVTAGPVENDRWPAAPSGASTVIITLHPAPPLPAAPGTAATVEARRWPADLKATAYLSSVLAQRQALVAGADIAVLHDGDELLETAEGNLFAVVNGALLTPPTDGRILPGVTRGLVLEAAERLGLETRIERLTKPAANAADALFVTSSVNGIRTITALDGHTVGDGTGGEEQHRSIDALRRALADLRR